MAWPATQAQPGLLRLVDAGTNWSTIDTGPNSSGYDWTGLDAWLDAIAAHEPIDVVQTFVFVPCWDSSTCLGSAAAPTGTNTPPNDLTPSGSPSFNDFVTAFVQHCNSNGQCVSDKIKYYEMWNEWDLPNHNFWTGNATQLYQMLAPAAQIIRQNVPNAVILTPSATVASPTYANDIQTWLTLENTNGKISDWVAWHMYLSATASATNSPEVQWTQFGPNLIDAQQSVPGWTSAHFANTETNFAGQTNGSAFTCPPAQYTADDCTGQIVRWQLLHASSGASSLIWFKWNQTIGSNPAYEKAYYYMMQYLEGGTFTAVCSSQTESGNQIWSCPFSEGSGKSAMFVWALVPTGGAPEGGTTSYSASGFSTTKDLSGNATPASASISIGPEPLLLEQ